MDLPLAFALLIIFGVLMYVLADGFDLGVGILFPFAPRNEDRDLMMASIAPLWDGNETWLVLGGSLLLAAFPVVYVVVLPACYLCVMGMLFALLLRGVAFEFRFQAVRLRRAWDWVFAGGSAMASVMQGFVLGALVSGLPLHAGALSPGYSPFTVTGLLCGLGLLAGYALLGAGWIIWKTDGATQVFGREIAHAALLATMAMMGVVSAWIASTDATTAERWFAWPGVALLAPIPIASCAIATILWRRLWGSHDALPFVLAIILFLLGFAGLAASLWPYAIPRSVTIWQGAADEATLRFIGVGALAIVPIIVGYLGHAYWVFRGKTRRFETESTISASYIGRRASSRETWLHLS